MSAPVKHIDIAEFRALGFVQEINRVLLHPHGLALEVTVMSTDKDDAKMIERLKPIINNALLSVGAVPGSVHEEVVADVALGIVSELWPRGSEHISGVWDCRDDPEGVYFGDLQPEQRERVDAMARAWESRRIPRERALGFMVEPLPDDGALPQLSWSREAAIDTPVGIINVFQQGTFAVRATWPDGKMRVRVLAKGTAIRKPDPDAAMIADLRERFEQQTEPVVVEDAASYAS